MRRYIRFVVVTIGISTIVCQNAFGGEIDILLNKLVEKGILTSSEAQTIQDETKVQVAKEKSEQKSYALPAWVQKMKLKGDFRLRYQFENTKKSGTRNRGRIRYRLGIITKPVEQFEVGAGFASGGDDPRSTNQTFDETFSSKGINLDYAYIQYQATDWMKLVAGKFKRKAYLWAPTDLLWDSDINPEGGAVHFSGPSTAHTSTWLNAGVWVIEESGSDTSDPYLAYIQPGIQWAEGGFDGKLTYTYYNFNEIKENNLSHEGSGNTRTAAGTYRYDYDAHSVGAEFGVKKPFQLSRIQRAAVFGEYVSAIEPDNNNRGFSIGLKFGSKKVKEPKTWQFKYIYAELGKDAWLDAFPDSDRYGGDTNIKSHEFIINYALKENVVFGLDYYYSNILKGTKAQQNLLQADLNIKF